MYRIHGSQGTIASTPMLTFLTLGPEGSNHHFVLERYLAAQALGDGVRIALIDDFHEGARRVIAREADYLLQCAVHPAAPAITGTYRETLKVVDAFVSPSRAMALVCSKAPRQGPGRVAVQPATQSYADLRGWAEIVYEPTVLAVQEGLIDGRYEAGIAFASLVEQRPQEFEVVEVIGTVCDAWMVFGRTGVDEGGAVVWTDSPASRQYRAALASVAGKA
ncbi:hypothetical protein J7E49_24915 [Variovorax paradoxus]|nr:hypothetical protein [Variovorax paradoxus]